MFTPLQRQTWRNLALFSILFATSSGLAFITSTFIDFNTQQLSNALLGQPITILDDATPSQYPVLMIPIFFTQLPFLLGAIVSVGRAKLLVPHTHPMSQWILLALGYGSFASGCISICLLQVAALFVSSQAQIQLLLQLYTLNVYNYVWMTIIAIGLFSGMHYRLRVFPRWLPLTSLAIAGMAMIVNFVAVNIDLPHFFLTLALPIITLDPLIWGIVLYLVTNSPQTITEETVNTSTNKAKP